MPYINPGASLKMLELLFGFFIGVWMAQQLPMPDVHGFIMSRVPNMVENKREDEHDEHTGDGQDIPLFAGEMPLPPAV